MIFAELTTMAPKNEIILNRVNIGGFKKIQEEFSKDRSKCKKTLELKGQWRLDVDYGPQFETHLKTERAGDITVQTDETLILGGGGTAVHPVHYCMAGVCGCFSAAFAKWAAMDGIKLRKFEIRAIADIDMTSGFGIEDGVEAVDQYTLELTVDSDAPMEKLNEILEITKKRCFCYYCMTTPIIPKIELIKVIPPPRIEVAYTICPQCFHNSMEFLPDSSQVCKDCGTKGLFIRDLQTKKIQWALASG
jgi:uncharacterized OsmC-like protein